MYDPTQDAIYPLCADGAEPDRLALFATLRTLWKDQEGPVVINGQEEPRTYANLGRILGYPKQTIAQWATGSGGKAPAPWFVIMRLCHHLGLGIAIDASGAKLYRITVPGAA